MFLKKQIKKRLSLKTQFKIEFLLLFTSSRKVLEKMPGQHEGKGYSVFWWWGHLTDGEFSKF